MQRRKTPGVTRVTFMTTGIFLMRLVNNPDSLKKYTHIIMDEVHERDLDIDFSMVVVKHLLTKDDADGLKFKLILMSATFNTELFANYFSAKSILNVENINHYEGQQAAYDEQKERERYKQEREWGGCTKDAWSNIAKTKNTEICDDEDEWIETKPVSVMQMPVKKADDPAEIIEINARLFQVQEFYLDKMITNMKKQKEL